VADRRTDRVSKAAANTKGTYFAAHFAQLRGRRGEPKAVGATRHDILIAYYCIVRDQVPFRELGPDWLSIAPGASDNSSKRSATRSPSKQTPSRRPPQPPDRRQPQPIYRHRFGDASDPDPNAVATPGIHTPGSIGLLVRLGGE